MSRKAAMSPKRRPRSASPTFGAPLTGPKLTVRPPTCRWRAGLRACSTNDSGACGQLRLDEVAPDPHALRVVVDQRAGRAKERARVGAADLEPGFLQHAVRRQQDPLDLLGAEHLERRPRHLQPRQGLERRPGGARHACRATTTHGTEVFGHARGPSRLPDRRRSGHLEAGFGIGDEFDEARMAAQWIEIGVVVEPGRANPATPCR